MASLIDCPKLKRRMKIYSNGEQLLKDFDRDFGFNFLNCQTIINEINSLPNASNKSQEMELILRYRHAKRALDKNSDNEKLLNVPQLLVWADKLMPTTTEDLMEIIQSTNFGENGSPLEGFFNHIEKAYEGAQCSPGTAKQGNLVTQARLVMAIRVVTRRAKGWNLQKLTNACTEMRSM